MKTNIGGIQKVKKCEILLSLENEEEVETFINILRNALDNIESYNPQDTKMYEKEWIMVEEIKKQIQKKFSEI